MTTRYMTTATAIVRAAALAAATQCTTDNVRQMSGQAQPLKIEAGCWSGTAGVSQALPTRLTHIVGGLIFGHDHAVGHAVAGAAGGGTADFSLSDATTGPGAYLVAGW